jgi:hypothetical protein
LREAIAEAKDELTETALYAKEEKIREGARLQILAIQILLDTLGRYIDNGQFESSGAIGPTH